MLLEQLSHMPIIYGRGSFVCGLLAIAKAQGIPWSPLQAVQGAWTAAEVRAALGQLEARVQPEHLSPHFRRGQPTQAKGSYRITAGAYSSHSVCTLRYRGFESRRETRSLHCHACTSLCARSSACWSSSRAHESSLIQGKDAALFEKGLIKASRR